MRRFFGALINDINRHIGIGECFILYTQPGQARTKNDHALRIEITQK